MEYVPLKFYFCENYRVDIPIICFPKETQEYLYFRHHQKLFEPTLDLICAKRIDLSLGIDRLTKQDGKAYYLA